MYVETHGLTKSYGRVTALSDCTLGAAGGEVFGLLGPNGAGKTTLLRTLLGFLRPTSGRATIDSLNCYTDAVRVHRRVSYLAGEPRLYGHLRGRQVLTFFSRLRNEPSDECYRQLARRLELDVSRRVRQMSTGMRQKLALVIALAPQVPLVVMDEPTSSLDPTVRNEVLRMIREVRREGRTVIFSSHVLGEVEQICDRVAILRAGRLVHTQVMSELRRKHRIRARLTGTMPPAPANLSGQLTIRHEEGTERVTIETPGELSALLGWLSELPLSEVSIEPIGLATVYEQYHAEQAAGSPHGD